MPIPEILKEDALSETPTEDADEIAASAPSARWSEKMIIAPNMDAAGRLIALDFLGFVAERGHSDRHIVAALTGITEGSAVPDPQVS